MARLQLRPMFDIDVDKAEVVVLESLFSLYRLGGAGRRSAIQALCLPEAPHAVAIEVRQKMRDDEGKVIQRKVGAPAQSADHRTFFLGRLPGQLVRSGEMILAVLGTALAPLTEGLGADTVALRQEARGAPPNGRSRRGRPGWSAHWGESATGSNPFLILIPGGARSSKSSLQSLVRPDPNNVPQPD